VREPNKDGVQEYKTGGWRAHYIMIICTLLYVINYADRQVFSVVLQPMKTELGLTDAQCGLAQTIFILGMALFSFPVAFIIDRWSRKKAMGIIALIWSVFTFATGLAKSFVGVIIPRAIVGVGEAGFTPGGVAMVSAAYSKASSGKALGIFNVAMPLGTALGLMVGGAISVKYGWRTPFFYFAIPGIILGILAFFMKDYKVTNGSGVLGENKNFGKSILSLIKIPTLAWVYIGYGGLSFMASAYLSWMPSLMMRATNVTEASAGMTVGIWGLMAIIAAPLGGFLADFWQKRNKKARVYLPALSLALASLLLIAVVLTNFSAVGMVLGILFGICLVLGMPAIGAVTQDVVPVAHKGLSFGLCIFFQYVLGGAWSPYAVGAISDSLGGGADGLGKAVMLAALAGLLGAIIFLWASRYYPSDVEKMKQQEAVLA
jgi:MFS family permease